MDRADEQPPELIGRRVTEACGDTSVVAAFQLLGEVGPEPAAAMIWNVSTSVSHRVGRVALQHRDVVTVGRTAIITVRVSRPERPDW